MLKNFIDWDIFILIGREGTIWVDGLPIRKFNTIGEMLDLMISNLQDGKTIVLDEFQRLPFEILERIGSVHPKGKLILSGSSMSVVSRVLGEGSPLLGKFKEVNLGLLKPEDLFSNYPRSLDLDYAPYICDPWTVPMFGGKQILNDLYQMVSGVRYTVPSLVGEVFHEEDRNLSEIYQGLLSCIGNGISKPSEMAQALYNKGVVKHNGASQVSVYLKKLEEMGLIWQVGIFRSKRFQYRMTSPIFSVYYYIDSKYGLERGLPPYQEVKENLNRIHTLCMEHYLVSIMAKWIGGYLKYSFDPEIDGIIVDRKGRPKAVIEVKWGKIRKADIEAFKEKTLDIRAKRYLITKQTVKVPDLEILTPNKIKALFVNKR